MISPLINIKYPSQSSLAISLIRSIYPPWGLQFRKRTLMIFRICSGGLRDSSDARWDDGEPLTLFNVGHGSHLTFPPKNFEHL